MATSTDPAPPTTAAADSLPTTMPDPAGPLVRQYLDETPHTYTFHDGTVITPERGDVCEIPYDPGDRRWGVTKAKVTRLPDNHKDQILKTAAAQAEARAGVLKAAAETGRAAS